MSADMIGQLANESVVALFDVLGEGIVLFDEHQIVHYCNEKAKRICEGMLEECVGHPWPDDMMFSLPSLSGSLSSQPALQFSHKEELFQASFSTLRDGKLDKEFGVCKILPLPQLDTLLKERDRLFQLATLNEMLPAILHELRNPLAAIDTMVQLLLEETESEEIGNDLHAILSEVRRMNLTLKGVGSVSHDLISSKNHAVDFVIEEVVRVMDSLAGRAGITIRSDVAIMPLLPIDPSVISAIVFNLLNNAIAASEVNSQIEIKARLHDRATFELSITDEGKGMTPEVLTRCRELFFTTKRKGNGIGLALCSQTVEKSGGEFLIESEVGKGTSITMRIPVTKSQRPQTQLRSVSSTL